MTTSVALLTVLSLSGYTNWGGPVTMKWLNGSTINWYVDTSLSQNLPYGPANGANLTQVELGNYVDRAARSWIHYGRANIFPRFASAAVNVPNYWYGDGLNAITHSPCPPVGECFIAYTFCGVTGGYISECDIIFYEDPFGVDQGLYTWDQGLNGFGVEMDWQRPDLHRIIVHEMGHALGFGHTEAALCDNDDVENHGPIMCEGILEHRTDVPIHDEWLGLGAWYGRRTGPVRFQYFRMDGTSPNWLYYSGTNTYSTSYTTQSDPRIGCTTDNYYGPDCAVGLITSDSQFRVQFDTFTEYQGLLQTRQSALRMNNSSILAPDVVLKYRNGGGEIVGAYRDHANNNRVWLVRWRPGDSTVFQWNTGSSSQVEPRVSYNEREGRYYAAVVERSRQIRIFRSNTDASSWTSSILVDSLGNANGYGSTLLPVAMTCDVHSNEPSIPTPPSCRILYLPYSNSDVHQTPRFRQCEISGITVTGCTDTNVTAQQMSDLADYGEGVESGYQGPAWIASATYSQLASYDTALILDNDDAFLPNWVDTAYVNGLDTAMSIDWCEYMNRMVGVTER